MIMYLTLAAFATISYHTATDSYYVDYTDPWADVGKARCLLSHD